MQVMRHILFGMLICTCLIGYSLAASLSLLMPASSRLPNNGHHSLSSISHSNALRNNYIKRSDELQTEVDQDVLDLESLKRVTNDAPTEKQGDKLATLEMQLAAASAVAATAAVNAGHHEQYDTSTYGNNEKQPAETDATIKVPSTDDVHSEIVTPNVNGAQGAQPKQYHGAARLAFGQNPEINAEYLFKHSGGQYSALDMAQYVFWTGDEEGVAKAVEEFIRKGLMSRENAIKFLRDISMGIDYLENAYATNRQVDPIDDNSLRDYPPTVATTTTTTTTTTTQKPIILVEKSVIAPFGEIPSPLMQLNKIPNEKTKEHSVNFDEASGRLRLADFLYAEYSLEEVIYQLAKVMFSQSLSKGSEEAQIALQRLTTFLEGEGTSGRISPALQKKVLDVLLVALSDCLAENPQLFAAAKLSLGDTGGQLSKQPDKHFAMQINE
ncbi:uncharacterized protein LOC129575609 isoform X2 [Sitodiplosis mosellana]|uniref:uncharacterized protein LOC129575609 isoform X2 n=1 Tax=Sitodiplosis mosellana TaxID=263140 RepID=UPI002443F29A|nr:uncharacterized protein LOC129575609 isoform X2 [Sitodiplosis mosellana]XP_055315448.1 uncharacterized protein LOC129575609 isoform X2 [Sitodiplosis mosellana]